MATEFTPFAATVGGLLIGIAAAAMLFLNGRITGISGIVDGAVAQRGEEASWRWAFLAGLLVGGLAWFAVNPAGPEFEVARSLPLVAAAGLLVGFGTKMSNGCTSGHGVCGNARLSKRSIAATLTFMAVGAAVVASFGGAA